MNVMMLWVYVHLLLSGLLLSSAIADEQKKDVSKSVSSKIQYVGEDSSQPVDSKMYGGSNTVNRYGGLPSNYGGFPGGGEILRNRFRGTDNSPKDESGDDGYKNDQGTDGSSYPYRGVNEPEEVANGVFSNPFLGERRRTYSTSPDYGTTEDGTQPDYGTTEDRTQPDYGTPYFGGNYVPSFGAQPGIYSSSPGVRPSIDQGYLYPVGGRSDGRTGFGQPDGAYGLGIGNGYGVYPGTFRNVPASYLPVDRTRGIYGGSPRSYQPALYGYGQYPGIVYPGYGVEYGRLRDNNARGDQADESGNRRVTGLSYPGSSPSAPALKASSEEKAKSAKKEDP